MGHLPQPAELSARIRLVMTDGGTITIPQRPAGFVANRYLIRNGDYKSALIYWTRAWPSGVQRVMGEDLYRVDSVRMRRSDGAMVRVTTSVIQFPKTPAFQAAG